MVPVAVVLDSTTVKVTGCPAATVEGDEVMESDNVAGVTAWVMGGDVEAM
jgi:hypothetical protein